MKVGDITKMTSTHCDGYTVKILDLFEEDGIQYAEVEPVGFYGPALEVPIERLKED